ncbi:MAG: ATP-binding protein [Muribaculaceae bacterium]|nr:ATP-binding protein [Muribaculaceae bacterium]
MSQHPLIKYPIGQQSFEVIRSNGYVYVDKTKYIETIINGSQYYFLGRPRRFGKSLFLSTLKCFFEGKRELFKGLYADTMDWDWQEYPVLHLDLNTLKYKSTEELDSLLDMQMGKWEKQYGIDTGQTIHSLRFGELIRLISEKTGKGVVILVDEYDKPLVNNIDNPELFNTFRDTLAALYSNFKSGADYIKLVFLTGVSRFGKLSVFSDLNNIRDISIQNMFAGICGISEEELLENFRIGIKELAEYNGETEEETIAELKRRYDGYHFSKVCPDIYNPFSLLNVFASNEYANYWIASGTPRLLVEQLKRTRMDLTKLMSVEAGESGLSGLDVDNIRPVALLYQAGYLTIKGYDRKYTLFRLGMPNAEVEEGFLQYLLPYYADLHNEGSVVFISEFRREMSEGRVDDFMRRLQSLFSDTSYEMKMEEERNVQNVLFILFRLIGMNVDVEYRTSEGRIDILVRTDRYVYIMELKYDHSAEEALSQIERKEYALPWSVDTRETIAIGINYSTARRTIDRWLARHL